MRFIHKKQEILREIVQQCKGRAAWIPAGKHPGIVLNPFAEADLREHLHVVPGTLFNALRLDELALGFKKFHLPLHFFLNISNGLLHLLLRHNVVRSGIDGDMLEFCKHVPGQGVKLPQPFDFISEELHPHCLIAGLCGKNFHRTRNLFRIKFTSLRSYCSSTSFFSSSSLFFSIPGRREITIVR